MLFKDTGIDLTNYKTSIETCDVVNLEIFSLKQ